MQYRNFLDHVSLFKVVNTPHHFTMINVKFNNTTAFGVYFTVWSKFTKLKVLLDFTFSCI